MYYALTDMGNFLLLLLPLKSQSQGPNPSLMAQIPVLKPKSQPQGKNLSQEAQIPILGPNLSLQARIWALRLGFGP